MGSEGRAAPLRVVMGFRVEPAAELVEQPGLADARLAYQEDHPPAAAARARERLGELTQLALAARQRRQPLLGQRRGQPPRPRARRDLERRAPRDALQREQPGSRSRRIPRPGARWPRRRRPSRDAAVWRRAAGCNQCPRSRYGSPVQVERSARPPPRPVDADPHLKSRPSSPPAPPQRPARGSRAPPARRAWLVLRATSAPNRHDPSPVNWFTVPVAMHSWGSGAKRVHQRVHLVDPEASAIAVERSRRRTGW